MLPLSAQHKSCKGETDTVNKTTSILSNLEKWQLFSFWSELKLMLY